MSLSLRWWINLQRFLFLHFIRNVSHLSLLPTSILLKRCLIATRRSLKLPVIARFLNRVFHNRFVVKIWLRYQLTMTIWKVHANFNFGVLHSLIHFLNRVLLLSINLHLLIFSWHHVNNRYFYFLWLIFLQEGMRSVHFFQLGFRRSCTLKLLTVLRIQSFFWVMSLNCVYVSYVYRRSIWLSNFTT